MTRHLTLGAVVIGLMLAGCSGDDEEPTREPAPPGRVETPNRDATPPNDVGALPPKFVKCMADNGFAIKSSEDVHSAPPQVLQACFGAIH
jgi:hypothetical protein